MRSILLALPLLLASCVTAPSMTSSPLSGSSQLVVVTTPDWSAVDGTMQEYERRGAVWQAVGKAVPIVVGRKGLAWGKGVVSTMAFHGPRKVEGDGKAPAGVYRFGSAFGFAAESPGGSHGIPYKQLTEATECVDDSASQFYNRLVERDGGSPVDWKSSERMRAVAAYRLGLVVEHNGAAIPRSGSCIFMHLWSGPNNGTAGCTAMDDAALEAMLRWLDPAARPLLVQLPAAELQRLRPIWSLP
jgi:D-alanyl-D-alanine dipeptidase